MLGVSIVVCCHNSSRLLPKALAYIKAQEVPPDLQWEVIVIDNASADDTAKVARDCWEGFQGTTLTVVSESRLGLTNARLRGLLVAQHEIVSFIDDDNWVAPTWIRYLSETMTRNPRLGAVGGLVYPAFETQPPDWWFEFPRDFAILLEPPSEPPDRLAGAGMSIRKVAWQALERDGFHLQLTDRKGKKLLWGGDLELTYAIHNAGWELGVDSKLRMLHFLAAHRLDWAYFRRMQRWSGASSLMLDARIESIRGVTYSSWIKTCWQRRALGAVKRLILHPRRLWLWMFSTAENREVLEVERELGRLIGLFTLRAELNRPHSCTNGMAPSQLYMGRRI
jgi:glycosyltransferase involved in cell wall biosynthesis